MNVLILGAGAEEYAWARALLERPESRVAAALPGFADLNDVPRPLDLDDALAVSGLDLVVVGGPLDVRGESLRRAAAEGLRIVCLHPPGPDSEAYYQVALSRAETGALVVPDLPLRLHPAVAPLRLSIEPGEPGDFRGLRLEATVAPGSGDLARWHFARLVDLVRALLGEVEAVTATGDPPGVQPSHLLVVHLRCAGGRRAEVRLTAGSPAPALLVVERTDSSATLEFPLDDPGGPSRLTHREAGEVVNTLDLPAWDARAATLANVALAGRNAPFRPDLGDATRAMEVAEGVVRSLRRGRTVELHYEEISEVGSFKSVMTSFGCLILLSILFVLPVALGAAALGVRPALYLAYLIPPLLVVFLLLQLLRFAARDAGPRPSDAGANLSESSAGAAGE